MIKLKMACPEALRDRVHQKERIIYRSSCVYDHTYGIPARLHDDYDCFVFNCPVYRHEINDHDLDEKQLMTPEDSLNGAKVHYFLEPIAKNESKIDWMQFERKFDLALAYYSKII